MKNNSPARARESDTKLATDAKSGKFFPAAFPDKCKRGKRALGANRKRKCFAFYYIDETSRRTRLSGNV